MMGCRFWLAAAVVRVAAGNSAYLARCDEIIEHGRTASAAHNRGDDAGAAAALASAQASFEAATALDDGEPQAWLNAANLALNTQRFELSLDLWDGARERCAAYPEALAHVEERIETTRLGLYSVKRDAAYAGGEGDVVEAIRWAHEQLGAAPNNPRAEHDAATLYAMYDEIENRSSTKAAALYDASRAHAAGAIAAYWRCGAPSFPDAAENDVDTRAYDGIAPFFGADGAVKTLKDVVIGGSDALILGLDVGDDEACSGVRVYGSATPWAPLHANFWLEQAWRRSGGPYDHSNAKTFPPPKPGLPAGLPKIKRAALAVGFASSNYYHFLTEVLPRVVALRPALEKDGRLRLLLPKGTAARRALLAAVLPADFFDPKAKRSVDMDASSAVGPGPRARVDALVVVATPRVHARDNRPTHALMPSNLLRAARGAVHAALPAAEASRRKLLIYCARGEARTRRVADEARVIAAFEALASPTVEIRIFDGGEATPLEAAALFGRAKVVVGVHGAALANALFCDETAVLVELGFRAAAARHYEYLAFALGIGYERIPLDADARSVAAKRVSVGDDAIKAAVRAAVRALQQAGGLPGGEL